jgi:predicted AAA+ superfamily ATPase
VYVRDSGILHVLMGIGARRELLSHPKCGASFEGWVIEQAIELLRPDAAYFWATHNGAELDLLILESGRRFGIEVKRSDAPTVTPSMRTALEDLRLDHLVVVYPGERTYRLSDKITVCPAASLGSDHPASLIPNYPKR